MTPKTFSDVLNMLGFADKKRAKYRCGIPLVELPTFEHAMTLPSFEKNSELFGIIDNILQAGIGKILRSMDNRLLFISFFPWTYYGEKCDLAHFSSIYNEEWKDFLKETVAAQWDANLGQWKVPIDRLPEISSLFSEYFDFVIDMNNKVVYANDNRLGRFRENVPFKRLPAQFAVKLSVNDILHNFSFSSKIARYLDDLDEVLIRFGNDGEAWFCKVDDFDEKIIYDKPFIAVMLERHGGCPIIVHYSTLIRCPISIAWRKSSNDKDCGRILSLDSLYERHEWQDVSCTATDVRKWLRFFDIDEIRTATAEINKALDGFVQIEPVNMFYLHNDNEDTSSNKSAIGFVFDMRDDVALEYEKEMKKFLEIPNDCNIIYLSDEISKKKIFEVMIHETAHVIVYKRGIEQENSHDKNFYAAYKELFKLVEKSMNISEEEKSFCRNFLQKAC